jgi:hypothetical protein
MEKGKEGNDKLWSFELNYSDTRGINRPSFQLFIVPIFNAPTVVLTNYFSNYKSKARATIAVSSSGAPTHFGLTFGGMFQRNVCSEA